MIDYIFARKKLKKSINLSFTKIYIIILIVLIFNFNLLTKRYFEKQLELVKITGKPLFLHCRNAYEDFAEILKRHHSDLKGGVVHSFTGTKEEAKIFTDMGYFIGINGCSLKTQENIDAMCSIPTEFLMIETGKYRLIQIQHFCIFNKILQTL